MFDAILEQKRLARGRMAAGAAISMALHTGALALMLFASTATPSAHRDKDLAVKFIAQTNLLPPPPPPPPLASAARQAHRSRDRQKRKTDAVQLSKQQPEPPQDPDADYQPPNTPLRDEPGAVGGAVGGVAGGTALGVVGGSVGGTPGGQVGGSMASTVLPFGEGMTRPEKIAGEAPKYTREALAAGIEGTMLVKCVITTEGTLNNCRLLKALPHMEDAVLGAVSAWKYKPVYFQGRAVAVDYLIQIKLVIPH